MLLCNWFFNVSIFSIALLFEIHAVMAFSQILQVSRCHYILISMAVFRALLTDMFAPFVLLIKN